MNARSSDPADARNRRRPGRSPPNARPRRPAATIEKFPAAAVSAFRRSREERRIANMSGTKSSVSFKCLLLAAVLAAATGCATPKYRVVEEEDPVTHVVNRYRLPANAHTGQELERIWREKEQKKAGRSRQSRTGGAGTAEEGPAVGADRLAVFEAALQAARTGPAARLPPDPPQKGGPLARFRQGVARPGGRGRPPSPASRSVEPLQARAAQSGRMKASQAPNRSKAQSTAAAAWASEERTKRTPRARRRSRKGLDG